MCQNMEGIEEDRCDQEDRPGQADSCNQEPCPAWNFGEWGKVYIICVFTSTMSSPFLV